MVSCSPAHPKKNQIIEALRTILSDAWSMRRAGVCGNEILSVCQGMCLDRYKVGSVSSTVTFSDRIKDKVNGIAI